MQVLDANIIGRNIMQKIPQCNIVKCLAWRKTANFQPRTNQPIAGPSVCLSVVLLLKLNKRGAYQNGRRFFVSSIDR